MGQPDKSAGKAAKKAAKTAEKMSKKRHAVGGGVADFHGETPSPMSGPTSPAERAARAAEKKVALEHWRLWIAAISILIALLTLLVAVLRSR